MRIPKFLAPNDTIGFIAPSYGCASGVYKLCFENALSRFTGMGYQTVTGPNCTLAEGYGKSNTPSKCGDEINDFFLNRDCKIIMSAGGGETMCEDLNFVDFEAISKAEPKWFSGYSDNTNLTFLLPVLADTAALYASCAQSYGMGEWHPYLNDSFEFLKGNKTCFDNYDGWEKESLKCEENPYASLNVTEAYSQVNIIPEGASNVFKGRMLGGCLDLLVSICGTKFDKVKEFNERYKDDGVIWFLEACDLNPMGVVRALWQLENAGWFSNAKGFIIGRSRLFDFEFDGITPLGAYKMFLEKKKVPSVLDVDLGHVAPMMPFVSGAMAEVTIGDNKLTVDYGNLS